MSTLLRVAFGTLVFAAILWTAAPYPAAAGLMLTFPALNGLAFLFAGRDDITRLTGSMLWMPLLNGFLCATYLSLFLWLSTPGHNILLAWVLTLAAALLWWWCATRKRLRAGIAPRWRMPYAAALLLIGLALTFWWLQTGTPAQAPAQPGTAHVPDATLKIALFAAALTLLIILPAQLGLTPNASGVLSGLPLVSFASLLGIAADSSMALQWRHEIFSRMLQGVWLAPAMAAGFIALVSRVLLTAQGYRFRGPVVIAGWLLCGAAIAAAAATLAMLS